MQLQLDVVQKDIAVYQTVGGSVSPAGIYHMDSSQGALSLNESADSAVPALAQVPTPQPVVPSQAASSFQFIDAQGKTATFTISYTGGQLHIQAENEVAAAMVNQNQQKLITAAGIVAAQDKLGVDGEDLQTVYLEK